MGADEQEPGSGERRTMAPRGRRRSDTLRIAPGENWYRDVVLFFVSLFVVIAVSRSSDATNNATRASREATHASINATRASRNALDAIHQQRVGRVVAIKILCGAMSAAIDAGRATITGGALSVTGDFERNLRALGYPPRAVRLSAARRAARAYAKQIATGVTVAVGGPGEARGVVRPDGSLDCRRLLVVSRATK